MGFVPATCTNATRECCHCTQALGFPGHPFHDPFHAFVVSNSLRLRRFQGTRLRTPDQQQVTHTGDS